MSSAVSNFHASRLMRPAFWRGGRERREIERERESVCVCVREREREKKRETREKKKRKRPTDIQTDRQTELKYYFLCFFNLSHNLFIH